VVIVEFPTMEQLRRWYDSAEYPRLVLSGRQPSAAACCSFEGVKGNETS